MWLERYRQFWTQRTGVLGPEFVRGSTRGARYRFSNDLATDWQQSHSNADKPLACCTRRARLLLSMCYQHIV